MFHPLILVLIGRIPLWLSATNRIHTEANLLVHVNATAMQEPQILSILCVSLALVTQHANCMHPIILLSVAFLTLPPFLHYFITRFSEKVTEHKMYVLTFSTTFV